MQSRLFKDIAKHRQAGLRKQAGAAVSTVLSGLRLGPELVHPALSLGQKPQALASNGAASRSVPGSACSWSLLPLVAVQRMSVDATAAAVAGPVGPGAVAAGPLHVVEALRHLRQDQGKRTQEGDFQNTSKGKTRTSLLRWSSFWRHRCAGQKLLCLAGLSK